MEGYNIPGINERTSALDEFNKKPHMDPIRAKALEALSTRLPGMGKVRTPMLDAFNADTEARKQNRVQRIDPMEVQNEMLFGEWPQKQKQVIEQSGGAGSSTHALQIVQVDANTLRILDGTAASFVADADMTSGDYEFDISGTGTTYAYLKLTQVYAAPIWTTTACEIPTPTTSTSASTSGFMYILIGSVTHTAGSVDYISQDTVLGSVDVARTGSGTSYVDRYWILA